MRSTKGEGHAEVRDDPAFQDHHPRPRDGIGWLWNVHADVVGGSEPPQPDRGHRHRIGPDQGRKGRPGQNRVDPHRPAHQGSAVVASASGSGVQAERRPGRSRRSVRHEDGGRRLSILEAQPAWLFHLHRGYES